MGYVVTARWVAKDGEEEVVLEAIRKLIPASRAECGCRFYQPNRDTTDPRIFFFYEIYDDEEAYKAHGKSEHFERYGIGEAIPRLESRERILYETIDV
jgi:quinol monooxygenase YgiN